MMDERGSPSEVDADPLATTLPDLRGHRAIRLPGELDVDPDLVRRALDHLNHIYAESTLQVALRVGRYVLDTFFDGDPEAFRRRGRGHATFTALADRSELHFSRVWLWRAVSVVTQIEQLPERTASALPFTHHTALLVVRDLDSKRALADRAATEGWPKRRLQEEVRRATRGQSRRGRPRLPMVVRKLNQIQRIAREIDELDVTEDLDPHVASELVRPIEHLMARLAELQHQVADHSARQGANPS
ncbi:MAG: hypothetical protein KTR31_24080 [Myxococcales bacterium]|nr:hypothetical protein [Myxococcales bacterium]